MLVATSEEARPGAMRPGQRRRLNLDDLISKRIGLGDVNGTPRGKTAATVTPNAIGAMRYTSTPRSTMVQTKDIISPAAAGLAASASVQDGAPALVRLLARVEALTA